MRYIRTGNREVRTRPRLEDDVGDVIVQLIGQKRPGRVENPFTRSLKSRGTRS